MSTGKQHKFFSRIKERLSNAADHRDRTVPWTVHIIFASLILMGGILYLVEVNATSTQGFEIRALEQKVADLEKIQKELEFRQTDASSMSSLHEKAKEMELVSVQRVETLTQTGAVALER